MVPNKRILVVDDEATIVDVVRAYLEKDGYAVFTAGDGRAALALVAKVAPAMVILDLMLPDLSGEDVCRQLRQESDIPILMLTAKDSEEDRVRGLGIGADDYLTKPFSPRELVARVRAILRRVHSDSEPQLDRLSFNDRELVIDLPRREVHRQGHAVNLTASEFKLLVALARHPGRVYSRFELINKVQGYDFEGYERTVDAHVKNLRQKLEDDARHPRFILTVYGSGYKFSGTPDA